MQKLSHQIYCFDGFALDLTRGCLLRDQEEIKLRPKSFEALKYLVENSRRLISKDELIHAVWGDTAVTDDSLVKCLKDIRRALSDEEQQIIKTVHGRGYIFDTEVSDNGAIARTTYAEETAGVQLIIEEEEETTAREVIEATPLPASRSVGLLPAHEAINIERLTTAIKRHRWIAVLGVLTLAVVGAAAIYFARPGETIDSVAVMPFVNVGGDTNTEYLSDGISESIINNLSQLPSLKKVIALNSVLRYKGKQTDPQAVGRELNVRAVLMGRLTQRGDDVVINVELVDVRDNRHLWGQQYNRRLADITAVQSEIAQEISEKLRLRLTGEEQKHLTKHYTESGEAYQLYLTGRYFQRKGTKEGLEKAIEFFEQALKKDTNFAPAYAGLAGTYGTLGLIGVLPPNETRQKQEWAVRKALDIDNDLAEAHSVMAYIREVDLNWPASEEENKRALELNPNSGLVHTNYTYFLLPWARFDEAMLHLKRAQELDPLSLNIATDIGRAFYFSRQYDRAIEQFKKTIEMDPTFAPAHARLASVYLAKGMYEEAITEQKNVFALDKRSRSAAWLAYTYAIAGKRDEAQKILDDLNNELSKQAYVSPYEFALIHIGLGDKDQAFVWLVKQYEERPDILNYIKVDPVYDSLRSDSRFTDLLRRMKLAS